jgi:hypothetical protein
VVFPKQAFDPYPPEGSIRLWVVTPPPMASRALLKAERRMAGT